MPPWPMIMKHETLLHDLKQNPTLGTDLGRGLRKVRMRISSKGKGKSGGARVITFTVIASIDETTINLLYIYDKSERENISPKEMDALLMPTDSSPNHSLSFLHWMARL